MRNKIVAGNWKMNKTFSEAEELIISILDHLDEEGKPENAEIILFPPFVYLELAKDLIFESPVYVGAQDVSQHDSGAYTGEISARMLQSMEIDFCLAGHSERRKYYGETDEMLARKVISALRNDINPVLCCGESLEEREKGSHLEVVKSQVEIALFGLEQEDFSRVIIAYEPVWAIGTGVNATPEQAQEMHKYIREMISDRYSKTVAENTTILYGGSCNAKNAGKLFSMPDVDGGLIGGASLEAEEFIRIISSVS